MFGKFEFKTLIESQTTPAETRQCIFNILCDLIVTDLVRRKGWYEGVIHPFLELKYFYHHHYDMFMIRDIILECYSDFAYLHDNLDLIGSISGAYHEWHDDEDAQYILYSFLNRLAKNLDLKITNPDIQNYFILS